MERFKQFMGFPLLATNLWLLWVLQNQRGSEAVLLLLALLLAMGFCAWFFGAFSGRWVLVMALLTASVAFAIAGKRIASSDPASVVAAEGNGLSWLPYSPAALDALRSEGKPVLLDFTASWCLTCQFNERTAINVPAVRKALRDKGVTAMKGDWTNSDPAVTAALKSFGRVGVPLAVYFPPGKGSAPVVLPELLTEKIVLDALGHGE